MREATIEKIMLLEQQVKAQLGEIEKNKNELYPLTDPLFMTDEERERHFAAQKKLEELIRIYNAAYSNLPEGTIEHVDFISLAKQKDAEFRGLIPLYSGDEFDNNIEECYSSTVRFGKETINSIFHAKQNNDVAGINKHARTYYACMHNCDAHYIGENIKSFLLSYENDLFLGKTIQEEKEEYFAKVKQVEDVLVELAQLKIRERNKGTEYVSSPEYQHLIKICQQLISRCEVLVSVIPKGEIELVNLHGLRLSALAEPEVFLETVETYKAGQK